MPLITRHTQSHTLLQCPLIPIKSQSTYKTDSCSQASYLGLTLSPVAVCFLSAESPSPSPSLYGRDTVSALCTSRTTLKSSLLWRPQVCMMENRHPHTHILTQPVFVAGVFSLVVERQFEEGSGSTNSPKCKWSNNHTLVNQTQLTKHYKAVPCTLQCVKKKFPKLYPWDIHSCINPACSKDVEVF